MISVEKNIDVCKHVVAHFAFEIFSFCSLPDDQQFEQPN